MAYFLRPDDPIEYRRLMNTCFVVIPSNAPSLSPLLSFTRHWSQLKIVERSIQSCFSKETTPSNLICQGYHKFKFNSAVVKTLTSLSWELALERVGDGIMIYLLTNTLIFMPIKCNVHQQVTGPHVSKLISKISMDTPCDEFRPSIHTRYQRKRKSNGEISTREVPSNKVLKHNVSKTEEYIGTNCIESNTLLSKNCSLEHHFSLENPIEKLKVNPELQPDENLEMKPRKRFRPPSWQRRKRRKKIDNQDNGDLRSVKLLCPCCSVLESLSRLSKDAEINRKFMFYNSKSSSSLFLGGHVLYSLKPGFAGTIDLLRHILGLSITDTQILPKSCFHEERHFSNGSSCLYHSLIKLLEDFRSRVEKCKHIRIMKKHCSSQTINEFYGDRNGSSSKDKVASFVWAICRSVIPSDLLGLPSFRRTLRRNISRFINLRRFEKFSLRQCLHKLQVSKFPILSSIEPLRCVNASNIGNRDLNQVILERWIFWLFSHIVVPLVQAKFYATESEHGKQNLYYYPKKFWYKMSSKITTSLKDQIYRCLDTSSVAKILSKRSFGFSKVRLCPKENGARPIANLRKPSRFCIKNTLSNAHFNRKKRMGKPNNRNVTFFKSVNTVLQDLHVVLKDLKMKEPERWGSAVFSFYDIHRKLCSFMRELKEGHPNMPEIYIVVSDVQKAFDTVNQDKLLSILNEIPMEEKYSLQKCCEIFYRKKSLRTSENLRLMIPGNNSGYTEVISHVRQRLCYTIIVSQEQSITIRSEKLKFNLKEHLKNNVLKLGRCFFLQTVGIPQGSVLSALLCTLYYGHMERNIIYPFLQTSTYNMPNRDGKRCLTPKTTNVSILSPKYTLLRFVDDFLFISTSKAQALSFFSRLQKGFCEYNCYMNQEKFGTNFDVGNSFKIDLKRQIVGKDGVSFMQWSGLLINSQTLEVQADYSRYHNDHLKSTLTVNWQPRPGRRLKAKLRAYMRPKCHSILFDTSINSPSTIRLNVFQAFVLCAMKFHCYVCELSFWCQISPGSCFSSIEGSLRYMYRLMNRRMYKVQCASKKPRVLEVTKKEVKWLGLTAYIQVLSKKKSRHKELLRLLRRKAATLSSVGKSSVLKYAVEASHSSILWEIKY